MQPVLEVEVSPPLDDMSEEIPVEGGVLVEQCGQVERLLGRHELVEADLSWWQVSPVALPEAMVGVRLADAHTLENHAQSLDEDRTTARSRKRTCPETNDRAILIPVGKGDATRTAILDDALRVASRLGFAGLTIGRLADDTEMSKSGLFAHFKSKQELQLQTLDHARRRFIDVAIRPALAAPRGERRVRALFDGWRTWDDTPPGGCVFIAASVEFDDQPGPVREALVQSQRDWFELIASIVGTAVEDGEFDPDLDAHQFAFELQGIMLANHHARRLLHDARADERTQAAFESLVARARTA